MVPFAIKEVREPARADVHKFVEDGWDHCVVVDLEVHASVSRETHQLFQDKASVPFENRVHN